MRTVPFVVWQEKTALKKKKKRTIFNMFENMTVNEVERELGYWVLQILVQS